MRPSGRGTVRSRQNRRKGRPERGWRGPVRCESGSSKRGRGASQGAKSEITAAQLRQMAEDRRACYEVWPDWALVGNRRIQVGFEVDLCAEAEGFADGPCVAIYEELKQIARAALPAGCGRRGVRRVTVRHSLHESMCRGFRREIILALHILHRRGLGQPLDDWKNAVWAKSRAS